MASLAANGALEMLASSSGYDVFCTTAARAPRLVRHIGRERELAFRAAGEDTGHEIDLDVFDDRYWHLCVWDRRQDSLVGAYRLGLVDASPAEWRAPAYDTAGEANAASLDGAANPRFYTSTLFRFDAALIDHLAPGIELGRAFVRADYQKQFAPLMLLWTGIGRFVSQRPQVRQLFGAVSIGASYSAPARALLIAYLRRHAFAASLAPLVTPLNPPIPSPSITRAILPLVPDRPDVDTLDAAVRALDDEGKGVPVLLRHYLRLGARALAFNVDPHFNHCLDALIVVDLPRAPEPLLRRYMGGDAARAYRQHHAR